MTYRTTAEGRVRPTEDTIAPDPTSELLAHVRALVAEHAEMRTTIEQHKGFWKDLP